MKNRIQKVQKGLSHTQAVLFFSDPATRYLSGFDFTDGCVLITPQKGYLLTDSRYIEAASKAVSHLECMACRSLFSSIEKMAKKQGVTEILVETTVSVAEFERLQQLPFTVTSGNEISRVLQDMRAVKQPDEIKALKRAQEITEQGFLHILPFLKQGVTEREAALELEFFMRRAGAQDVSFDLIVVAGENTSLPHGVPSHKLIQTGDLVTMDFGALYNGYHADMTRTVAVGEIGDREKTVYDTVLRAQQAALQTIRAGVIGKQADAVARDVIIAAGFGEYFGHGTGHGVGVEIHEAPRLSPAADKDILVAGNVVTVEPGIYLPGQFGVRIEDMVLVTEQGIENLTKAEKQLIIL
jgi:Xaa-Pro aminopeptidase